jgi:hypothetical protein
MVSRVRGNDEFWLQIDYGAFLPRRCRLMNHHPAGTHATTATTLPIKVNVAVSAPTVTPQNNWDMMAMKVFMIPPLSRSGL